MLILTLHMGVNMASRWPQTVLKCSPHAMFQEPQGGFFVVLSLTFVVHPTTSFDGFAGSLAPLGTILELSWRHLGASSS